MTRKRLPPGISAEASPVCRKLEVAQRYGPIA
jgi:hypothetical protein